MDAPPFVRRLFSYAPIGIIILLFGAPLLIWAVKDDPSPIQTVKAPGRVLAIEDLPGPGGRVTVTLEDGSQVVVEPDNLPHELEQGDRVIVSTTTDGDGKVMRSLETVKP
jgi:hypothetical protein